MAQFPLGLIHRLLLPFYSPHKIARILSQKHPGDIALVLQRLKPGRSLSALRNLPEDLQFLALNNLGDFGLSLLKLMPVEERSIFMVNSRTAIVKRFSQVLPDEELEMMAMEWDQKQRLSIFPKLDPVKAATLVRTFPEGNQITLLEQLPAWVRANLMRGMKPDVRAQVLDALKLESALDLFDRWDDTMQSEVLRLVSISRRMAVFDALQPMHIGMIIESWEQDDILNVLLACQEEKMFSIYARLMEEKRREIFTLLPPSRQHFVLTHFKTDVAADLLKELSQDDRENILAGIDEVYAIAIRRALTH